MATSGYKTRQKEIVLHFFQQHAGAHLTAAQAVAQLQEEPEALEHPERHRRRGDGKDQRAQEPAAHPETAAPGTGYPGNAPEMRFFIDEPEGIPYNITERVPETGQIGGNSGF